MQPLAHYSSYTGGITGAKLMVGPQTLLVIWMMFASGFEARIPATKCIAYESPQTTINGV